MAKIKESSKACLKELESNMSVLKQNEQITQVCSTYLYFVQVWLGNQLLHYSMLIIYLFSSSDYQGDISIPISYNRLTSILYVA